ncbi:MAG: diguanylate cyclase [Desulfuromonadaceae bacterium]
MPVATDRILSLLQQHFGVWVYSVQEARLNYCPTWLNTIVGTREETTRSPRSFLHLIHPDDRTKLIKKLHLLYSGSTTRIECEMRLMCVDRHIHRIEINAVAADRDQYGIADAIIGTATSVHARSLQEESLYDLCQNLQSSETRYRALLQDAKSPIIVLDSNTKEIVDVNNSASTVTGYSKRELLGMGMNDLVEIPDDARHSTCGERETRNDMSLICKSGTKIAVDISCSNVSVQDRNLTQCIIHDISLRKHTEDTLRHMASHDPLTGLPNRTMIADQLEKALHNADALGHVIAVCFADLNKFKHVNDVFGHEAGDIILKNFAARLSGAIRHSDMAARLGGDEFIFILENLPNAEAATKIVKKIIPRLNFPYGIEHESIEVNCSIGISTYPTAGSSSLELLHNADKAMYYAKKNALDYHLWPGETNDAGGS